MLMPRESIVALNEAARNAGAAFVLAVNMGVTTSIFSDFGAKHIISDEDGEPTQMLAVSAAEVVPVTGIVKVDGCSEGGTVLVLTLASDHGLQDGDVVALDDMRGTLSGFNGRQVKVRRFGVVSPTDAKVDLKDVAVQEMLKNTTGEVLKNFQRQYNHYKSEFASSGSEGKFKQREITLFNRLVLDVEADTLDLWREYRSGGLVNSVKPAVTKEYQPFDQSLTFTANPQMMDQEAWHAGAGCWVQLAIAATLRFRESKGRFPALLNEQDAVELAALAKALSEEQKSQEGACWLQKVEWGFPSGEPAEDMEAVEANLKRFSMLFDVELTGMCAFLGGVVAQEVIKKTGKYTPIEQWVHHDDASLVQPGAALGEYAGTRYAHQAAVFGSKFMDDIRNQRVFLVGCGALGCEYLKGLALMGACSGPNGKLIVTDMDRIEVSNLSRQFLFRQPDVGNPKSTSAARVVKGWNPDLKIEALEKGVGVTSEDFFDDEFWNSLDLCWNALDNVIARRYTDKCCLWYGLPLLESGTLGTKCNSDVFLPHLTKSYNDGIETDTNEAQIAMCTLRSFPFLPLHCIEFAKQAYFSDYMEFAPQQYESFRKDPPGFFEQLDSMSEAEQFKSLKMIKGIIELQLSTAIDFDACIHAAFNHYCRDFIISIRDLVYNCDEIEKSTGKPFWTGTKRRPMEAKWESENPPAEAMEYLYATSNCYAFMWKVPFVRNRDAFHQRVVQLRLQVPAWSAPSSGKVETEEDDGEKVDPAAIEALKAELYAVDPNSLAECEAHDFEKDDDTNFHIDFLTASTNLRASNYDIKHTERSTVKVTAGRIIPALATTTAMICGLVDVEFLKLVLGMHKEEGALDKFYNANINLATGLQAMNLFRPEPAIVRKTNLRGSVAEFTSWDKVEIEGEIALKELVKKLESKLGGQLQRLHPVGNDKVSIYDSSQVKMLDWRIDLQDGQAVIEPDEVYSTWPQLKMAVQMLGKLPDGPARKNFENQVLSAAKSLQGVKDNFASHCNSKCSEAYIKVLRPSDEEAEKQKYFDAVLERRNYLPLQADMLTEEGEDADLPLIKYTFR
ncbi:Ubiquitin-activating enzyme E1 1 [Durusdinium trenchii]|uniref:Ubiquitin-activating enzyme E1 1 n=2 Tax=Durusdinium trenchii TaxID=1381693 RepID=A0ABP0I8S6_9DINO